MYCKNKTKNHKCNWYPQTLMWFSGRYKSWLCSLFVLSCWWQSAYPPKSTNLAMWHLINLKNVLKEEKQNPTCKPKHNGILLGVIVPICREMLVQSVIVMRKTDEALTAMFALKYLAFYRAFSDVCNDMEMTSACRRKFWILQNLSRASLCTRTLQLLIHTVPSDSEKQLMHKQSL